MSTIEEQAKKYIEEHDHTTDVMGWEWDTYHVVAFTKLVVERERKKLIAYVCETIARDLRKDK